MTLEVLVQLKSLKMLSLQGNPLCLVPVYRKRVSLQMPNLHYFDEVKIISDEDERKKELQMMYSTYNQL